MSVLVRFGAGLAIAGTVHAALNRRRLRPMPVPSDTDGAEMGRAATVSVLIPARDEATTIGECLERLRVQIGARIAEILVLDDESGDDTAAVVRAAAQRDPRVVRLAGAPLPTGWLGKPHACAQLAERAAPSSSVLIFLDADVRLEPAAVAAAVALLRRSGLDLISPVPRQLAIGPAERLIQPLLAWSWLTTLPLRVAERSARPSLGAAVGQFIVVRRDSYERAGGHAAIRSAVLDDLALLRAIKGVGGHGGVVDGTTLAHCRMYSSWPQLRDGYAKSLSTAFGSGPGAAAVVAAFGLAYVVPAVAALRGSRWGLAGYLAGVAGRVLAARTGGDRVWPDALAQPVSVAVFGYLTGYSFRARRRGGVRWKGRAV